MGSCGRSAPAVVESESCLLCVLLRCDLASSSGKNSRGATDDRSLVDLGRSSLLGSWPGVGLAANSLYELSVMRGIFQGKRRRVMQQKMMARDQMSTSSAL